MSLTGIGKLGTWSWEDLSAQAAKCRCVHTAHYAFCDRKATQFWVYPGDGWSCAPSILRAPGQKKEPLSLVAFCPRHFRRLNAFWREMTWEELQLMLVHEE
jgi:hypothetical protein